MACTATASRSVKQEVIVSLEMSGCVQVTASLDRPNEVKPRTDIDTDFRPLVDSLKERVVHTPRMLVYCQSFDMCAELYANFHHELQEASYYPRDSERISDNRLFGMFHSSTCQHNKDIILKSLHVADGVVCVVFATVALGMAIHSNTSTRSSIMELHIIWKTTSRRVEEQAGVVKMLSQQFTGSLLTVQ